ncbi:MAG: hypothetical protein K940chlam6_01264 [Chlamydiae bacterium]|nr:hypothetical protein [Chlamydiota bacterium]
MIQIGIEYPLFMKMQMTTRHEISDSTTLADLKMEIFEQVWDVFGKIYTGKSKKHGEPGEIHLSFEKVDIIDTADLKKYAAPNICFHAVFGSKMNAK